MESPVTFDCVQQAEDLKTELREFYRILRQEGSRMAKPLALARLRKAVARAKPFAEGLDADWLHLATEQHEGYLQLVSQIDTAMREIDKYR